VLGRDTEATTLGFFFSNQRAAINVESVYSSDEDTAASGSRMTCLEDQNPDSGSGQKMLCTPSPVVANAAWAPTFQEGLMVLLSSETGVDFNMAGRQRMLGFGSKCAGPPCFRYQRGSSCRVEYEIDMGTEPVGPECSRKLPSWTSSLVSLWRAIRCRTGNLVASCTL
jgi:hypothetical protein